MWRSGVTRRKRHTVLAEMVETAVQRDRYAAPWRAVPHLWDFFSDEGDILRELQQEWRTALAGAIYVAIDAGDGDLHHDVLTAFSRVQRRHAGLRRILEAHADHPAIAAAMRKERTLLSGFSLMSVADAAADTASMASAASTAPSVADRTDQAA